ncbi:SLATT domain-containing protein [Bacillus spizizenii]|uniref:SLATT domain-containing protein n=1 Tax=Bacillus subtilis TaxID=1423 RepID=UPI001C24ECE4|nr:SLATT domain-containing protein [Bacillus subtilis]MBU8803368.1 SLATT domain-containing protein [Bacillus subtilis]MCY8126227.1 SLATT domain-containing protein [Bacillus spizizenii]
MEKRTIKKSIAQTAYNIGFGGKKHFLTYDIYRVFPRLISILTTIIGVFQLSIWYESINNDKGKDFFSISIIAIGIIGLVLDLISDNKEKYNLAGRELLDYFNELRDMYNLIDNDVSDEILQSTEQRRKEIVIEAKHISISNQAILTHWLTNISFFKSMQSQWIVKELDLKFKDKYPFLHFETIIFILIFILVVKFLLCF